MLAVFLQELARADVFRESQSTSCALAPKVTGSLLFPIAHILSGLIIWGAIELRGDVSGYVDESDDCRYAPPHGWRLTQACRH